MAIVLAGTGLTVEKLVRIARRGEKVELHPDALERIKQCRSMLEDKLKAREIMYGTNTGIGEFSEVVLTDDQVKQFQRYLIYNHAAGIGEPAPIEYIRGAMASRINVHAHGKSGCRPEITLTLLEMLTTVSHRSSARKVQWVHPETWRPCHRSLCSSWAKARLFIRDSVCQAKKSWTERVFPFLDCTHAMALQQ